MKKRVITIVVSVACAVAVAIVGIIAYNCIADKNGGVKEMVQKEMPTENVKDAEGGGQKDKSAPENAEKTEEETPKQEKAAKQEETQNVQTAPAEDDKVYTPTFMYFVTNADEESTKSMIDELKAEYDGKVTFDIKNVDKDPELKKNFEFVDGNTPALIMLDTHNNISMFELKCADKEKLKNDIENALNA